MNQDDIDMEINAALTPDEAARSGAQLMMIHQMLMQDPAMEDIYGVTQRHALFDKIFDAMGIKNTQPFMVSPLSQDFQALQQLKQAMNQEAEKEARIMAELQKETMAAQIAALSSQADANLMNVQTTLADKMFDNQLDSEEFKHKQIVDFEKLEIERQRVSQSNG